MRTLIWIDDHVAGVALRKPLLENRGYSVLTARSGQEGLALISAKAVDAVLVDCPLPDMDGERLVSEIRAINSALPIVVLSRLATGIPQGVASRADATFTKACDPFNSVAAKLGQLIRERTQKA